MNKETILMMLATVLDFDGKLDLLTTIEVLTSDEEITRHCREIRDELVEE